MVAPGDTPERNPSAASAPNSVDDLSFDVEAWHQEWARVEAEIKDYPH